MMFTKTPHQRLVFYSSTLLENGVKTPIFPQGVDNSVENNVSHCEKTAEQPPKSHLPVEKPPQIVHGFATKHGGVSTLPYIGELNLGFSVGEARAVTLENYRLLASAVGAEFHTLLCANQTHTTRILTVDTSFCGMGLTRTYEDVLANAPYLSASERDTVLDGGFDGFVTRARGVSLVVRAADCVPILFSDPENAVIGACHAGWRSTLGGIAAKTVDAMCAIGASKNTIRAAIGPSVCRDCYEVDDAFYRTFLDTLGTELCREIFTYSDTYAHPARPHCDLKACNRLLLEQAGLSPDHIDVTDLCTCCAHDDFHSHRYAVKHQGGKRGLGGGMIAIL